MPLGAVIVSEKIARFFDDKYLYAGLTYNGHALACAAALGQHRGLRRRAASSRTPEPWARTWANGWRTSSPSTRPWETCATSGCSPALEFVKDRTTKEPADLSGLKGFLLEHGLYVFNFKNVLFVVPPLIISKDELDEGLTLLDEGIAELMG